MDWVTVGGLGAQSPLLLARVQRGAHVFGVLSQLVASGFADEHAIRGAVGAAEHCAEARAAELGSLENLPRGAAPPRTGAVHLVEMPWFAERFSGAPRLTMVLARMMFTSLEQLPASLPVSRAAGTSAEGANRPPPSLRLC